VRQINILFIADKNQPFLKLIPYIHALMGAEGKADYLLLQNLVYKNPKQIGIDSCFYGRDNHSWGGALDISMLLFLHASSIWQPEPYKCIMFYRQIGLQIVRRSATVRLDAVIPAPERRPDFQNSGTLV